MPPLAIGGWSHSARPAVFREPQRPLKKGAPLDESTASASTNVTRTGMSSLRPITASGVVLQALLRPVTGGSDLAVAGGLDLLRQRGHR